MHSGFTYVSKIAIPDVRISKIIYPNQKFDIMLLFSSFLIDLHSMNSDHSQPTSSPQAQTTNGGETSSFEKSLKQSFVGELDGILFFARRPLFEIIEVRCGPQQAFPMLVRFGGPFLEFFDLLR